MSVYENGEIKLNKPLNYEVDNEVIMAVQIDGGFKTRIQTIRIEILDVDEPPTFINQPKPYLAVVPHERPIGYQIFRFNARDENGDGDKDVIYNLINTEPPGMFTVDQDTGIVRTAVNKYPSGITCKVYVQVSDKTPMNQNVNQESEIAVLEVVASNRPPQFYKTHYEVSVPQDIQVESSILHIQAKIFKNVDNINHPLFFNVEPRFDLFVQTEEGERMPSQFFSIEPFTGVVHLKKRLDNEDDYECFA
uniref:CA domain-containing protein n=1 Tax=Rhabditophanes sp. KR3021 TaxID=114890 RepID=A0AC35TLD4_9BILA